MMASSVRSAPPLTACKAATPARRNAAARTRLVSRSGRPDVEQAIANNPLFNSQFMGVLQDSLARQGEQALTSAPPTEPRVSATEEVLTVALSQSKQTLMQLMAWREQIERQVAVQQKQVDRMEFALNKSRNDAAYLRAMKEMLHGDM
ncbi:hypothetical protein ACK3TF_002677 [Chlorella vulgaris]